MLLLTSDFWIFFSIFIKPQNWWVLGYLFFIFLSSKMCMTIISIFSIMSWASVMGDEKKFLYFFYYKLAILLSESLSLSPLFFIIFMMKMKMNDEGMAKKMRSKNFCLFSSDKNEIEKFLLLQFFLTVRSWQGVGIYC